MIHRLLATATFAAVGVLTATGLTAITTGSQAHASISTFTVQGKVDKVVPAEKEIYVISDADGKKYEYYFTKNTQLIQAGRAVTFDLLTKGIKVKVVAQRKGKRLDPMHVEILD